MSSPITSHSNILNPKKRSSLSASSSSAAAASQSSLIAPLSAAPASQPPAKRARPNHPLRQTSFPERDVDPRVTSSRGRLAAGGDNESLSGSFTGSLSGSYSGSFPRLKKKRGRKELSRRTSVASATDGGGGLAESKSRAVSAKADSVGEDDGYEENANGEFDDDDEDEDEVELMAKAEGEDSATAAETEKKNIALLTDAFTPDQSSRYDSFKRAKLNKPTVRKIVNQTLSQSVPPNVITTISGYTKVFVGELIEKARLVQEEWAAIEEVRQEDIKEREEEEERRRRENSAEPKDQQEDKAEGEQKTEQDQNPPPTAASPAQSSQAKTQPPEEVPNPHRSQLLPQHIREALRRYKRDGEGGGVGFSGLSMGAQGVRGSFAWSGRAAGGKRLFR